MSIPEPVATHISFGGAEAQVRDGARRERDEAMRAQVCVVGSGAGGATIAYELARRGHSVVLLEEGAYRTGREMSGDPAAMLRLLYREGGATATAGPHELALALGRCVGGTTVIQNGTAQRAPDEVLHAWEAEHGVSHVGPGELRPYYERAERELGVAEVPEERLGRSNALLERGAAALGLAGGRLARMARGCLGTGVCTLGCPQDALLGMHVSHVPAALAAGAVLYTRTRAERLLLADGRVFGVAARFLDENDRPTGHTLRVVADRVVLACGALLTPVFLEQSGVGKASGQLGRNLRVQPVAHIAARFDEEVRAWEEIPQAYEIRELAGDGIRIQGQALPPVLAAAALPGVGAAHRDAMARFAHLAWCEALVADESSGTVTAARGGFPVVRYRMNEVDRRRLLRGISLAAEALFAAGAREVFPPVLSHRVLRTPEEARALREADVADGELRVAALHPMGTARMADDRQRGVTSAVGEVHGTRDLYVADASLFPAACGARPLLTIVALAHRIAEHISAELGAPL